MINKTSKIFIALITILLLVPATIFSAEFISRDDIIITPDDTTFDDLYIFGGNVEIYGPIMGDLAAFSYSIETENYVEGNYDVFAYEMFVDGVIERSARLVGNTIDLNAEVRRNLLVFGNRIDIDRDAVIGRDLTCAGEIVSIGGNVKGKADIGGGEVVIMGVIDGDVNISADEISIVSPAEINGNLVYTSKNEANIDPDVVIAGEIDWKLPEKGDRDQISEGWSAFVTFLNIALFFMALLTGFILIVFFPSHAREAGDMIINRFWYTLAVGFITVIGIAVGAFIAAIIIVGLPVSIFGGMLGFFLFYVGKIYAGIALGRIIFGFIWKDRKVAVGWEFLVGFIVLSLLFQIPILGVLLYILAYIVGAGAFLSAFIEMRNRCAKALAGHDASASAAPPQPQSPQ